MVGMVGKLTKLDGSENKSHTNRNVLKKRQALAPFDDFIKTVISHVAEMSDKIRIGILAIGRETSTSQ